MQPKKPTSIAGMPEHWQNFWLSIIFQMVIPLIPIFAELWEKHNVSEASITLATAMYAIALGGASRNAVTLGLTVVISLIFGINYGSAITNENDNIITIISAAVIMTSISTIYAIERYNRHVVEREIFLEFMRKPKAEE